MPDNEEIVEELGWLDSDGICHFPEEAAAVPAGWIAPGLPLAFFATGQEKYLQEAVDKGWIKFVDGEGNKLSFKDYVAKYPGYPDPIFILTLQGRWPPQPKKFVRIGRFR